MSFNNLGINRSLSNRLIDLGYFQPNNSHVSIIPDILAHKSLQINSPLGAGYVETSIFGLIHLSMSEHNTEHSFWILSPSEEHISSILNRINTIIGPDTKFQILTNISTDNLTKSNPNLCISTPETFVKHLSEQDSSHIQKYTILLMETNEMLDKYKEYYEQSESK